MVSLLAFYSKDPCSNPAEVYTFSVKSFEKKEISQKRPGLAHFLNCIKNSLA